MAGRDLRRLSGLRAKLTIVRGIRRHLAVVFGAWLLCHTCGLAAAPIAMCVSSTASAPALECTCDHGDATECPMHHKPASESKPACTCRNTSDSGLATLVSLLGPFAVVDADARIASPDGTSSAPALLPAAFFNAPTIPDPPPPRA
jgi:hypothetical protein